jgi:hypothetical protein
MKRKAHKMNARKKILCGILNWKREAKLVKKNLDKFAGDVVVCTDNSSFWKHNKVKEIFEAVENVAACKNMILKYAIDNQYEYVFLIEDDTAPSRKQIFTEYVSLMEKYELNATLYGYGTVHNRVLNDQPNPCIICNDGRGRELYINRYPCSSVIVLKVNKEMKMFDENLQCLETDYLLYDMAVSDQYPFKGFFFDIPESWKEWRKDRRMDTLRNRNLDLINKDRQQRGNIALDANVDKVIEYIKERRG